MTALTLFQKLDQIESRYQELTAQIKKNPGVKYASVGTGSALHVAAERWAAREGPRPSLPREWVDIVRHWLSADSSLALEELGLALTPLDASIRRACAWYARHGYIPRTEGKDR